MPAQLSTSSVKSGIVAASVYNTLLLKSDGTVICLGSGEIDTTGCKNIKWLAATGYFTVGVRADGTVVATGSNDKGQITVNGIRLW